jgi:hypothetical protein
VKHMRTDTNSDAVQPKVIPTSVSAAAPKLRYTLSAIDSAVLMNAVP